MENETTRRAVSVNPPPITADAPRTGAQVMHLPLDRETRTHVPTDCAAHYLNRQPQTLRGWACYDNGPIRAIRVNGRLAWPVADIRRALGMTA